MKPSKEMSDSNPYWSDPKEEAGRIKRILKTVGQQHDANTIAFVIAKSNNDNFVAYRWNTTTSTLEPFWITTENVKFERRSTLNLAETMLYGVEMTVTSGGDWLVNLNAESIRDRTMKFVLGEDDTPKLIGTINGRKSVVEYAYAQMRKGLLPDVEYVRITGRALDDDSIISEVIHK